MYDAIATQLSCCGCFVGCGAIIILTGGPLAGAAGYGAYRVLA